MERSAGRAMEGRRRGKEDERGIPARKWSALGKRTSEMRGRPIGFFFCGSHPPFFAFLFRCLIVVSLWLSISPKSLSDSQLLLDLIPFHLASHFPLLLLFFLSFFLSSILLSCSLAFSFLFSFCFIAHFSSSFF